MEPSWLLAFIAVVVNLDLASSMYLAQQHEVLQCKTPTKGTRIEGTDRLFRHWQQFHCMTWGNIVGLGVMSIALWHAASIGAFELWHFAVTCPISAIGCWAFAKMCTSSNHADDYGFIQGRITIAGKLFLTYSWIQGSAGGALLLATIFGDVPEWISWTGATGFSLWGLAMVIDAMHGYFNPVDR